MDRHECNGHVNVNQERQGGGSGSRLDKGKSGKGGKGKERGDNAATSSMVNAGTARRGDIRRPTAER